MLYSRLQLEAGMTWLALLFVLLCAFGGPQSGALAQEGVKFSYPRALERIESLVVYVQFV